MGKSKCTQDWQKICTKLLPLSECPTNSPSANKIWSLSRIHLSSDHIVNTQKKLKKSKHGFLLSISILVYRAKFTGDLKNSNLVVLALKKNCTYIPPLKPTKNKSSFGKFNSPSTKVHLLTSRPRCCGHELTSLEWSKLHTFISTTTGGAYKPKMSPFYVTFARQLCDDTHLPGWV